MKIKGVKTLPMSSAPKDGTRILIQHSPAYFKSYSEHENIGKVWIEAYWKEDEWNFWCGKASINSTGTINMPLGWVELEKDEEDGK